MAECCHITLSICCKLSLNMVWTNLWSHASSLLALLASWSGESRLSWLCPAPAAATCWQLALWEDASHSSTATKVCPWLGTSKPLKLHRLVPCYS